MKINSIIMLILSVFAFTLIGCAMPVGSNSEEVSIVWTNSDISNFRMATTSSPSNSNFYDYGTMSEISIDEQYTAWVGDGYPNQFTGDYNLNYGVEINSLDFTATHGLESADFHLFLDNNYFNGFSFYMFGVNGITMPDFFYGHTFEITIMWESTSGTVYEHTYSNIIDSSTFIITEVLSWDDGDDVLEVGTEIEINDEIYSSDSGINTVTIKADAEVGNINDWSGWYECYKVGIKSIKFIASDMTNYYTWTNPGL